MTKNLLCANHPRPALTLAHFLFCACKETGGVDEGFIQDLKTSPFYVIHIVSSLYSRYEKN